MFIVRLNKTEHLGFWIFWSLIDSFSVQADLKPQVNGAQAKTQGCAQKMDRGHRCLLWRENTKNELCTNIISPKDLWFGMYWIISFIKYWVIAFGWHWKNLKISNQADTKGSQASKPERKRVQPFQQDLFLSQ